MRSYIKYLILTAATPLLVVSSSLLPIAAQDLPIITQTQTTQNQKPEADRLLAEGIEFYDKIRFGEALGKFEEALVIYQEIGDKVGVGATLQQIGRVYHSRNEYQQALDYYQRALLVQREIRDDAGARVTLNRIGSIYDKLGDYQQALDYYQQAVVIRQEDNGTCSDRAWQRITLTGIGKIYQRWEDYPQAFANYQQAAAIERELSSCPEEDIPPSYARGARLFYNTGLVAQELGKYQEAWDYFQQALAIYQRVEDQDEQWIILNQMGVVSRHMGEYQQALDYFQQAQEMGILFVHFGQGGSLNNIGLVYYELEEYPQALLSYEKALASAQEINDRVGEGVTLNNIGGIYEQQGKYHQALDTYQQALAIVQEVGDQNGEAVVLNNLGVVYDHLGKSQQAADYYQQAATIWSELGVNTPGLSITLNLEPLILPRSPNAEKRAQAVQLYQKGMQLSKRGQYQPALEELQQALIIARELGDESQEWKSLNQMGLVYKSLGEYKLALDFLQQALGIPKQGFENTGAIHFNIGQVYSSLGDYPQALEFYQQASALAGGNQTGKVRILNGIGSVNLALEQYELALDSYQQALTILKSINYDKKLLEGATLNNIGQVYREQGKYELALEYYQQALTIQKLLGGRWGEGAILDNIGEAYYHLEQYDRALEYYQQALVISQEVGNRATEGENLSNIGYLLEQQQQPELAIVFFKQSVNVREGIRESIKELPPAQQQSYTATIAKDYRHLADLLLQQNRILEAQQVLDLLKVQELEDYLRNVRGNETTAQGVPNLKPEEQIQDGLADILDQAIAIGKELNQLRQQGNRTPQEEQRLVQLVNAQEQIIADFNYFIESPEVEALITQLTPKTRKPDLVDDLEDLLSIQDNLRDLQQNAVLLYPLILEDRLELVLTTPDSPPIRRTVSVTKDQLNQAIVSFRQALNNPGTDAQPPAEQLYNWLIKPLEKDLEAAQAETLIYAPDGQLRYIPLAALYDGQQWLVQRYRINNITAASLTDLGSQPTSQLKILAGAFTTGSHSVTIAKERFNFGGLPYAGVEVKTLAETIPDTTQLFNDAFNPQDTKPQMGDHTILHFATHGAIVAGRPEESFILFGDGTPVTIADVRNWNLNNVDLVVLSACQTGLGGNLGTGAEILGLGYQMQRAGARAAIASLWTVDDGGTQALMNAFYGVLQGNQTKAEALRQAQIALITGDYTAVGEQRGSIVARQVSDELQPEVVNRLNHPFYWAPFILIGNGL
ncbi:MAG: tetratricopeptide repeat protein [Symploca sp. SIO3E6]|nr:tetratricopeptide repeat protein [Caldora sp. SIO3E6]